MRPARMASSGVGLGLDEGPFDRRLPGALAVVLRHRLHGCGEHVVCLGVDLATELGVRIEAPVLGRAGALARRHVVGQARVGLHVADRAVAREGRGRIPGQGIRAGCARGKAAGAGQGGSKKGIQFHQWLRLIIRRTGQSDEWSEVREGGPRTDEPFRDQPLSEYAA